MKFILIAEDDQTIAEICKAKLKEVGFEAEAVASSKILEIINTRLPDLIIFHLNVSSIDDVNILETIKNNDQWKKIPVVVISNLAKDEKVKTILTLGTKEYSLKVGHDFDDIIKKITEIINNLTLR